MSMKYLRTPARCRCIRCDDVQSGGGQHGVGEQTERLWLFGVRRRGKISAAIRRDRDVQGRLQFRVNLSESAGDLAVVPGRFVPMIKAIIDSPSSTSSSAAICAGWRLASLPDVEAQPCRPDKNMAHFTPWRDFRCASVCVRFSPPGWEARLDGGKDAGATLPPSGQAVFAATTTDHPKKASTTIFPRQFGRPLTRSERYRHLRRW